MSSSGCEEVLWWLTSAFQREDVQIELRRLRQPGANIEQCTEVLLSHLGPNADLAREELSEFPSMTVPLLLDAWESATAAGVPFRVTCVRPDRPIEYARRRRITFTVTVEDGGVEVSISHVAGHHAAWLPPRAVPAGVR